MPETPQATIGLSGEVVRNSLTDDQVAQVLGEISKEDVNQSGINETVPIAAATHLAPVKVMIISQSTTRINID